MERGFTDLTQAHLSVLVYPPPEGERPTDLAERTYMTKQAMNYLLGQLESLGYIERHAEKGKGRRLVHLTRRGWQVFESQWASMQQLETLWAARIGQKRFDEFVSTLQELSTLESNGADALPGAAGTPGDKPRTKPGREAGRARPIAEA